MVEFACDLIYSMPDVYQHTPVMPREVEDILALKPGQCLVDGTLGLGGHSKILARHLGVRGKIIGIDRDKESIGKAKENLKDVQTPVQFVHDDFRNLDAVLGHLGIDQVDAMLFDFGISSFQLEDARRGFSLKADGPLDMRMNQENWISASDLINSLSEKEISAILKNFGEERWHNRIARSIVARRSERPILSTADLKDIVLKAMPAHQRRQKIHPATRTFQAFRIAVNRELESIDMILDKCLDYLKSGGRIAVISFHSLEDRIVKHKFRQFKEEGRAQILTKKPLRPAEEESRQNPRARSARLRGIERL